MYYHCSEDRKTWHFQVLCTAVSTKEQMQEAALSLALKSTMNCLKRFILEVPARAYLWAKSKSWWRIGFLVGADGSTRCWGRWTDLRAEVSLNNSQSLRKSAIILAAGKLQHHCFPPPGKPWEEMARRTFWNAPFQECQPSIRPMSDAS